MDIHVTVHEARAMDRSERAHVTDDLLRQRHRSRSRGERQSLDEQIVVVNLRVAHAVAARYRRRGTPLEDLQQAACEGLVKAVGRFDVDRNTDFLVFAVPTMRGEVLRHFRDHAWTVRPPRRLQELQWAINRVIDELGATHGRAPQPEEVRDAVGVSEKEYDDAMGAYGCMNPASLDEPAPGCDSLTRGDALTDGVDESSRVDDHLLLCQYLGLLSQRDRRIVHLRFVDERTQCEIGDEFGVSQAQVSRWLAAILSQLRADIESDEATPLGA